MITRGSVKWLLAVCMAAAVASCGGGSTTPTPEPPAALAPGAGEGSSSSPIALTVGTARNGLIGAVGASYYMFTAKPGGGSSYTISITNATVSLSWYLYDTAGFTGFPADTCSGSGTADRMCYATVTPGTVYYLRVFNTSLSEGGYTVNVTEGGGNQGSTGSPVPLTVGTPYSATINNNGASYYSFTAGVTGSHIIGLTEVHANLSWSLYADAFVTQISSCNTASSAGNETCSTANLTQGAAYYLKVTNLSYSTDDAFTITISAGASEGSTASPVVLTVGTNHVGALDASNASTTSTSYYTFFTEASATSSYNIMIDDVTPAGTLTATVLSDGFSGSFLKSCSTFPCNVQGLSPETAYYVRVTNSLSTPLCTYSISITPGGSEGSQASPVALTLGTTRTSGADGSGMSYYKFVTDSASGGSYTVAVTNTQTNVSWTLYSGTDWSWSTVASCNTVTAAGAGDETCVTTNLDANTTYYLKVSNTESAAATYAVTATMGGGSDGSRNHPLTIEALHAGGVLGNFGTSYYAFTTGPTAINYFISLTGAQTDLAWTLYANSGFSGAVADCNTAYGITGDESCMTNQYSPYLTASSPYYLEVKNWSASSPSTYTVRIEPLDHTAGCSGGAVECFAFDSGTTLPAGFVLSDTITTGNKTQDDWRIVTNDNAKTGGAGSMKNGALSDGYSTCFAYTKPAGTSSVSFSLKTDSESYDRLIFTVDGTEKGRWSGVLTPWRRVKYPVDAASSHTYKWCYTKDFTGVQGQDAVWVDDIEFK